MNVNMVITSINDCFTVPIMIVVIMVVMGSSTLMNVNIVIITINYCLMAVSVMVVVVRLSPLVFVHAIVTSIHNNFVMIPVVMVVVMRFSTFGT